MIRKTYHTINKRALGFVLVSVIDEINISGLASITVGAMDKWVVDEGSAISVFGGDDAETVWAIAAKESPIKRDLILTIVIVFLVYHCFFSLFFRGLIIKLVGRMIPQIIRKESKKNNKFNKK